MVSCTPPSYVADHMEVKDTRQFPQAGGLSLSSLHLAVVFLYNIIGTITLRQVLFGEAMEIRDATHMLQRTMTNPISCRASSF